YRDVSSGGFARASGTVVTGPAACPARGILDADSWESRCQNTGKGSSHAHEGNQDRKEAQPARPGQDGLRPEPAPQCRRRIIPDSGRHGWHGKRRADAGAAQGGAAQGRHGERGGSGEEGGEAVMKLMGRHALVTGADSGIGQAIAREFAREGANVVVHYHQDEAGAQQTAAQVRWLGRRALVIRRALSQPEKAGELFQGALNALGTIDVLVNCAGVNPATDRSVDMTLEDFQRILDINLVSPWVLSQATARHMGDAWLDGETAQAGVTVNITSAHEVIPSGGGAAQNARKSGPRNATGELAREVARKHIRVNDIAPGSIAPSMNKETLEDADEMEKSLAHNHLARVRHPDEVAHVAVFLAAED